MVNVSCLVYLFIEIYEEKFVFYNLAWAGDKILYAPRE